MLIEQPHFVHPVDVALSGTMRTPDADPGQAVHPDYVAIQRAWLGQYLIGEYNRLVAEDTRDRARGYTALRNQGIGDAEARAQLPPRWLGREEPQIRDLTDPYTDANGRTWQLPHLEADVLYDVGWIGTLQVNENPDWTPSP